MRSALHKVVLAHAQWMALSPALPPLSFRLREVLGHTEGGVLLFIGGGFIPRGGIGIATGGDCISDPEPTAGK